MQSIFLGHGRAKSKAQLKRVLKGEIDGFEAKHISLEATSMFGNEYDGPITEAPNGRYTFVGPSPYDRRFYGTIVKTDQGITIS